MKKSRKILSLFLSVAVLVSMVGGSFITAGAFQKTGNTIEKNENAIYENFTMLGDSICLGFSLDAADYASKDIYDIIGNAEQNKFYWSYPSVVAGKLGLNPNTNLRNLGICAAWSGDIKSIISEPLYQYKSDLTTPFTEKSIYTLPKAVELTAEDVIKMQLTVDGKATGFDTAKITGEYKTASETTTITDAETGEVKEVPCTVAYVYDIQDENGNWYGYQESQTKTLNKGTKVRVLDSLTGAVNSILLKHFKYVSSDCYDENGYPVDKNKDGEFNEDDFTYLPYEETGFDASTYQTIYTVYKDEEKQTVAEASEYCENPMLTATYVSRASYDERGNIKDVNEDGNKNIFDVKFYPYHATQIITYLQLVSVTVYKDASKKEALPQSEWMANPDWAPSYYDYITENIKNSDLVAIAVGGNDIMQTFLPYFMGGSDNEMIQLMSSLMMSMMGGKDATALFNKLTANDLSTVFTTENIEGFIDYFSSDTLSAFFANTIANCNGNIEGSIKAIHEINPDAQVVAVSHFNPFGVVNYFNMLSMYIENGVAQEKLTKDAQIALSLMSAIFESVALNIDKVMGMSESEISAELSNIVAEIAGAALEEVDTKELSAMIVDISFPIAVALLGTGFEDTYTELNKALKKSCKESNAQFVDISECPANGQIDPHPNQSGHAWIADKIYDTIVPEVKISAGKNGEIALSAETKHTKVDGNVISTRLHNDLEFEITADEGYKVSEVKVDGKAVKLSEEGKLVLTDVTKDHKVAVSFVSTEQKEIQAPADQPKSFIGSIFKKIMNFFSMIFGISR